MRWQPPLAACIGLLVALSLAGCAAEEELQAEVFGPAIVRAEDASWATEDLWVAYRVSQTDQAPWAYGSSVTATVTQVELDSEPSTAVSEVCVHDAEKVDGFFVWSGEPPGKIRKEAVCGTLPLQVAVESGHLAVLVRIPSGWTDHRSGDMTIERVVLRGEIDHRSLEGTVTAPLELSTHLAATG